MPIFRLFTIALIPLVLPIPAGAQSTEVRLTLSAAVERALAVSPLLEARSAQVAAGTADLERARAARWPDMDLGAGYNRLSDVPPFFILQPEVGFVEMVPNLPNRYTVGLDLLVPLYTGGRIPAGIEASEHRLETLRSHRVATGADLELHTIETYLALRIAEEEEDVLEAAIETFEAHLEDVRNFQEVGLAAANDVLAVQVERDRAELSLIQARNGHAVAVAALGRLLNLPVGTSIITEPFPDETPVQDGSLSDLVQQAVERRPERVAAASQLAAAAAAIRLARAAFKPQLGGSASWDYSRPNTRYFPLQDTAEDSWQVGVAMAFRVLDGGKRQADVARAEAEAEAAHHLLEDLDRSIRLEVEAQLRDRESAQAAIPVARRNEEAAQENLRVARDRYNEGLIPSSERLDAEVALVRAGLDRNRALASDRLATARLRKALGLGYASREPVTSG